MSIENYHQTLLVEETTRAKRLKQLKKNQTTGDRLEKPTHKILSKYRLDVKSDVEHRKKGSVSSKPDHIVITFLKLIFMLEDKNWPSGILIHEGNFWYHILSRFIRFERETGLKQGEYVRIVLLGGVPQTKELLDLLERAGIIGIFFPAIEQDSNQNHVVMQFVEDSLCSIFFNGGSQTVYNFQQSQGRRKQNRLSVAIKSNLVYQARVEREWRVLRVAGSDSITDTTGSCTVFDNFRDFRRFSGS